MLKCDLLHKPARNRANLASCGSCSPTFCCCFHLPNVQRRWIWTDGEKPGKHKAPQQNDGRLRARDLCGSGSSRQDAAVPFRLFGCSRAVGSRLPGWWTTAVSWPLVLRELRRPLGSLFFLWEKILFCRKDSWSTDLNKVTPETDVVLHHQVFPHSMTMLEDDPSMNIIVQSNNVHWTRLKTKVRPDKIYDGTSS